MTIGALAVTTLFLLSSLGGMGYTGDFLTDTDLIAGQHMDVGDVVVSHDDDYIYVLFTITEPDWYLAETHVDITTDGTFPLTKSLNPKVGQFAYSDDHGLVEEYEYAIPKSAVSGWEDGFDIAAHAVVVEFGGTSSYASSVEDYEQGLRKDGGPVREGRSDPEQALEFETGQDETNFFSLGFDGWIIIGFDCPIWNLEGDDVKVWEDTWGSYPLETADVYASQDGSTWTYLGEADNTERDPVYKIHTVTSFDLEDVDMDWAKYIKVVDTTDPGDHNAAADGYDLNAVEALHGCIVSKETAWGDGTGFEGSSWAMYFTYVPPS